MAYEYKNSKIASLQPSRLTQSIKSNLDNHKNDLNINSNSKHNQTKNILYTQDIYEVREQKVINDDGFKKNKGGTIQKLNELKRQYEQLRNIQIDDSFTYSENKSKRKGGSVDFSEKSLKSHKSIHNTSKLKNIPNKQTHTLLQYQKKQLQTMLANSMNKIEELIRAEVEYKKKIYELSRNPINKQQNTDDEETIKNLRRNQKNHLQKIETLKNENDKLRKLNFNLTQRIRSLQSQNFNLQTETRRTNQQKRRLQQTLLLEKQGGMSAKIEVRKFQLEKDMIERQKAHEIQRLRKTIKDLTLQRERQGQKINQKLVKKDQQIQQLNLKIRQYQIQLLKPRKAILSEQIKKQSDMPDNNFHNKIALKLKQLQKNPQQQKIQEQIHHLKTQIDKMLSVDYGHDQKHNLQQRIRALQQVINQDNEQKVKFLDELNHMVKDYHQLQSENAQLKERLKKAYKQNNLLMQNTSYHIQKLQKSRKQLNLDNYSEQIHNYLAKLRRLEAQNQQLKSKLAKISDSLQNSQSKTEERIRDYSRRMQQAESEIQKLLKQNKFNLQMANAKYQGQIQISRNNLVLIAKQKQDEILKFQSIKRALQNKFQTLRKEHQQLLLTQNQRLQSKQQQIQRIKRVSEETNARIRQQYEQELFVLLNRLDELIKTNERYAIQNSNLIHNSGQLHELRNKIRKMSGFSHGLDHLWQIKEAEYCNLNILLKQLKEG